MVFHITIYVNIMEDLPKVITGVGGSSMSHLKKPQARDFIA
jgi:hypothetical protein